MNKKIPLSALALVTTAGCGGPDSILGSWDCTSLQSVAGNTTSCPDVYSEGLEVSTCAYGLDLFSESDSSFVFLHVYDASAAPEPYIYSEATSVPATVTVLSRGTWRIQTDEEVDLTCTAGVNELDCEGLLFDDEVTMTFGEALISRVTGYL